MIISLYNPQEICYYSICAENNASADAPVAQGIEQWFPVPCARGSNPFRCAYDNAGRMKCPAGVFCPDIAEDRNLYWKILFRTQVFIFYSSSAAMVSSLRSRL